MLNKPSPIAAALQQLLQLFLRKKSRPAPSDFKLVRQGHGHVLHAHVVVENDNYVFWSGFPKAEFKSVVEVAHKCDGRWHWQDRHWYFPEPTRLKKFLHSPGVTKKSFVIPANALPTFKEWRSPDGQFGLLRPANSACARMRMQEFWSPVGIPPKARMFGAVVTLLDADDNDAFAEADRVDWALPDPVPVTLIPLEGSIAVKLDPKADPRHLIIAALLRRSASGTDPVVVSNYTWGSLEHRLAAAGFVFTRYQDPAPEALSQVFDHVPGWNSKTNDGYALKPHQKDAVITIGACGGRALLADEMGLGKTATAVAFATSIKARRALIVAPLTGFPVWQAEIARLGGDAVIEIGDRDTVSIPPDPQWVIVSYERLVRRSDGTEAPEDALSDTCAAILSWRPEVVIVDEAHRAKNMTATRSVAVAALASVASSVLLLTGTPLRNHPREVLMLLALLSPTSISRLVALTDEWATMSAAELVALARQRLAAHMIRRTKVEALPELPPVVSDLMPVVMDSSKRTISLLRKVDSLLAEMEFASSATKRFGLFAQAWQLFGLAKATSAAITTFVLDRHKQGKPTLVFAVHIAVAAALSSRFRSYGLRVGVLTGETPADERKEIACAFQDGRLDVFVGTVVAGGESLTLTRADAAVMVELSWVPAELDQAGARGHRIGQTSKTYSVVFCHADHPIDEIFLRCVRKKLRYTGDVLDELPPMRRADVISKIIEAREERHRRDAA